VRSRAVERVVAQTLQASLLPRALPAIEGLDLAGRLTEEVAELLGSVRGETADQTAEGCLRQALEAGGGATRDDIAVLVVQVGLATAANPAAAASTVGRTPAGESSTRGQC
jgi:serine phosphatase RsbU (regulator of sigma subunit)